MDLGAHGCLPREECCNAEPILRACDGLVRTPHTIADSFVAETVSLQRLMIHLLHRVAGRTKLCATHPAVRIG
eukprot:SAG31_NODE_82_length_27046_cov_45.857275_24_plen_73_part_00